MSGIFARAFGYREFLGEDAIKEWTAGWMRKGRLTSDISSSTPLRAMLIFSTSKQQTWIVTGGNAVDPLLFTCIVLDDLRKEDPSPPTLLPYHHELPVRVEPTETATAGKIYFGTRPRGWFYSKKLFADRDPAEAITNFLKQATTASAA